ncbi:MAG: glycoside hydrolase family 9 protein [Terricaulis sp.]
MIRRFSRLCALALLALAAAGAASAQPLTLNSAGYYETRGVNVLVFSNWYDGLFSDSKISGVELIHHGVRTATNGDVRLMATPGQWDEIGALVSRNADPATGVIETTLRYADYDFTYVIRTEPRGDGVVISVNLASPLPTALEGRAGFNLEFVPSAYFHHSYLADGNAGQFPLYPSGPMRRRADAPAGPIVQIARGADSTAEPLPFATGRSFVLAPEDDARRVTLTASEGEIALYDGRNQAQNGWFVLRGQLPSGRTGRVLEWTLNASSIPNWVRTPVIGHSQVGYAPNQRKVAVIELDRNDRPAREARLLRINADGSTTLAYRARLAPFAGSYLRYNYQSFDFSDYREPGLYVIDYAGQRTAPFRIGADVYADAWHPTLDVFFPVQMDHMFVNEAYRVWHGDSHRDDALQAPVNHEHHDLYRQGPTTDTQFQPYQHIPGLNVGSWYDAGDFDIRTQTTYAVVRSLVAAREDFGIDRDETTIDQQRRYVDIHVPDGQPDIVQQVEHGVLWLIAQHRTFGFAINGVVEADLSQYHHLGDAVTKTDGLVYDARLRPDEVRDGRSGLRDDRWAFTNRSTPLNYGSAAALAAASRVLRGHNDALAAESLAVAQRVWEEEHTHAPIIFQHGNTTGGDIVSEELSAAVELLITTRDQRYARRIEEMWPQIEERFLFNAVLAARAIPYMPASYKTRMVPAVRAYAERAAQFVSANPYGVPIGEGGWAGNGQVVGFGLTAYTLNQYFPEIVSTDAVFRALDYLYGTHPGSNVSFVSGVGAVSKEVAYGNNRADFSFIAGGVVPGTLILKPDFPENREDWPFMWGENEYVVNLGSSYIQLVNAANRLANPPQ